MEKSYRVSVFMETILYFNIQRQRENDPARSVVTLADIACLLSCCIMDKKPVCTRYAYRTVLISGISSQSNRVKDWPLGRGIVILFVR